jgi:surface polysaccharide O-acyltransferase-like enzyme
MMLIEKKISNTISNLNFPLMIGVVVSHCFISDSGNAIMGGVSRLFSTILPISCVPIFFLISGYLFFCNVEKLTGHV